MNKFTFMAQASKSMNANISEVDASVILELVKTPYLSVNELINRCELLPFLIENSVEHLIKIQMIEKSHDKFITTYIGDELVEIASKYYIQQTNPEKLQPHKNTAVVTTEFELLKEKAKEVLSKNFEVTKIDLNRGNYIIKLKKNALKVQNVTLRNKGVLRINGFNFNQEFISKMEGKGMKLNVGMKRYNGNDMYLDIQLNEENINVLSEM